ncbi:15512_t:CDS:2, partial [Acaulospora colombiana]
YNGINYNCTLKSEQAKNLNQELWIAFFDISKSQNTYQDLTAYPESPNGKRAQNYHTL